MLSRPLLALFASLVPALAQDPAPETAPPTEAAPTQFPAELFLDWVDAVVGPEVILHSDIERKLQDPKYARRRLALEAQARAGKPDQEALLRLYSDALTERAEEVLKVRGGRDLGFDPRLVRDLVDRSLKRDIEGFGGYSQTSRRLSEGRVTPAEWRSGREDALLARSFHQAMIGKAPGPTGRLLVDREIRPGLLKSAYDSFRESQNPIERELVGFRPERVVLHELILDASAWGGVDETVALVEGMRSSKHSRSQFEDLVRTYGAVQNEQLGLLDPIPLERLRDLGRQRYGDERLFEFVSSAEPGAVSPPLPYRDPRNNLMAVHVYRLDERLPGQGIQPFAERAVQRRIRENLQEALDRRRIDQALLALEERSFLWPESLREYLVRRRLSGL